MGVKILDKVRQLEERLRAHARLVVGCSGGVDSTCMLAVARIELSVIRYWESSLTVQAFHAGRSPMHEIDDGLTGPGRSSHCRTLKTIVRASN